MEQVQPSPMFRLLQERATCEQTVKNFVREYAGVLDALDEYLPHQLSFRCKSTCFSSRTGGYFDAATSEIIVCEPPQSDARRPQELHDTMHHELIHAIEVIRDNLDLSGKTKRTLFFPFQFSLSAQLSGLHRSASQSLG